MSERIFITQKDVLQFLHDSGLKISRAKLSQDYRAGKLRSQPNKTFLESDVTAYAECLKAPDFRPEANVESSEVRLSRRYKAMLLDFCAAMPDIDAIDEALGKWLAKDDNDPEISQKLAVCQRRVARRIANSRETGMLCKEYTHEPQPTETSIPQPREPKPSSRALAIEYRRNPDRLTPDQIKIPEIPGGYDKIDSFDPHARFCLTGIFAYGERGDCEKLVTNMGGKVAKYPVLYEQSYVIVGTLASPEWSCKHYGNKIELGLKYRSQGAPVKIITEDDWIKLVLAQEKDDC